MLHSSILLTTDSKDNKQINAYTKTQLLPDNASFPALGPGSNVEFHMRLAKLSELSS